MTRFGHRLPAIIQDIGQNMTSTELGLFHFNDGQPNFDSLAKQNGFCFWLASDLMTALGYNQMAPVLKAVNKAIAACAQLEVSIPENFVECKTEDGGKDWKLSRFACYLTVMNGDSKNRMVATAQAYFITMADAFRQYVQEADGVERVMIRREVSERETALASCASMHGVEQYAYFQNAGYRGLYNMDLAQIRRRKRVPTGRTPLDFMGKTELAANLFRLTQTEEKIRNEGIRGQRPLEHAAETVGKQVRKAIADIGGQMPETLPPETDIKKVKSGLKRAGKEYAKIDKR